MSIPRQPLVRPVCLKTPDSPIHHISQEGRQGVSASQSRFHGRSRRHHEDADSLADAITELCLVGYTQSSPELRQELISEQFVMGQSDPELKKYLWVVIQIQKDRKLQTLIEVCTDFAPASVRPWTFIGQPSRPLRWRRMTSPRRCSPWWIGLCWSTSGSVGMYFKDTAWCQWNWYRGVRMFSLRGVVQETANGVSYTSLWSGFGHRCNYRNWCVGISAATHWTSRMACCSRTGVPHCSYIGGMPRFPAELSQLATARFHLIQRLYSIVPYILLADVVCPLVGCWRASPFLQKTQVSSSAELW